MKLILLMTFVAALLTGSARAEETAAGFMTGGALLAMCDSVDGEDRCTGYIAGVADTLALAHRSGDRVAGSRGCIPPSGIGRETRDIVTRILGEHPEQRPRAAIGVIVQALTDAFPCPPLARRAAKPGPD
jgi:hypothetical protein